MDVSEIEKRWSAICEHIAQKQLKSAFDALRELSQTGQSWMITDRICELETNYQYMLHYLLEGEKDPEQERIYQKLLRDLYALADETAEQLLTPLSSSLFFEKKRMKKLHPSASLETLRELLTQQNDTLSFIELLEEGREKGERREKEASTHDKTVSDLFYTLFISASQQGEVLPSLKRWMDDAAIATDEKGMFISALTLNLLQCFDAAKAAFLLDLCHRPEPELAARAIIGIIPVFQCYNRRLHLYSSCGDRLKLLSDDPVFTRRFITAVLEFIQAHETEKITKRLTEEIIPEMMKLSPMIGKKIKWDEWMGETGFEDKNPEWQKILDESGLSDKLQEFSELHLKGADVFHSTFSNLKSFPFFQEMSNWFLPFNPRHSSLHPLFNTLSDDTSLIEPMMESHIMCDSDKYSFCFSIMMMPQEHRRMMMSQMQAESDEIKRMMEEEKMVTPDLRDKNAIRQYVQDLYRFFKLFPRRREFRDIFNLPLNYHQIEAFHPITMQPAHLEQIALHYFEKNNFPEALSAYTLLSQTGEVRSEIWQKIGYCRQMAGDINEALKAYLHADLIEGNNTWLLHRIAHCYRVLKEPETALGYYRRLEQLRPDDLNIQLNIGHCHLEMKAYEKALNRYFKVELSDSNNTRAWRSIAWCAFLTRKFDVAQRYYSRILDKQPNAHDYLNAGHVALCLNRPKECVTCYRQSMEKAGDFAAFQTILSDDVPTLRKVGIDTQILPLLLDKIRYDAK